VQGALFSLFSEGAAQFVTVSFLFSEGGGQPKTFHRLRPLPPPHLKRSAGQPVSRSAGCWPLVDTTGLMLSTVDVCIYTVVRAGCAGPGCAACGGRDVPLAGARLVDAWGPDVRLVDAWGPDVRLAGARLVDAQLVGVDGGKKLVGTTSQYPQSHLPTRWSLASI